MKNKLLVTTALVGLAFASSAMAAEELKEYTEGSVISADDTGHTSGDTRISFMGDATLEKDVTFGNYVTLHNKTNLTGDKKLTVTGYLTQTEAGSDVSGVDLEIQKGAVKNSLGTSVEEGELVLGNNLTVGNVTMADGTGIYLYKTSEEYASNTKKTLTIADGKEVTFAGNNYITGADGASLTLNGDGSVANEGDLTISNNVNASVDISNKGNITLDNAKFELTDHNYESDGGSFHGAYTQDGGSLVLSNNATITTDNQDGADKQEANKVTISNAEKIEVTNGSAIDTSFLEIHGDAGNKTEIIIGGNNPNADRETDADEQWRNDAYILSYNDATIENAEITIKAGGHLQQAATGDNADSAEPHTMTITNSTVAVETGGSMISSPAKEGTSSFALAGKSSVDLNGGIINGKISVGDNSEINVNNAGSTIKTLAGDGTLNINANTSVSDLFGSASKIGTWQ